jgi:hypothetical protein
MDHRMRTNHIRVAKMLGAAGLLLGIACFLYANLPFTGPATRSNSGKALLQTHWMGEAKYAGFAPEPQSNTLGCWSTTFAQIAYFHRLSPTGISEYHCSKGYIINEDWNEHIVDWSHFDNRITDTTSSETVDEMARYCYAIATIVQKDFGTGKYVTRLPPITNLENQLNVKAKQYFNYRGLLHSKRKTQNIIMREIEAHRPLFLYYRNMQVKGSGHSVVLDGYRFSQGAFEVHLNFGWGGRKDGWYRLFESIATEGDTELRILITIRPESEPPVKHLRTQALKRPPGLPL